MEENPYPRMIEVLKENGLAKYTRHDRDGSYCLFGVAEKLNLDEQLIDQYLCRFIDVLFPGRRFDDSGLRYSQMHGMEDFNNHDATSLEDVVLVLKHAAAEWEIERGVV